jgi:hypothetical protein
VNSSYGSTTAHRFSRALYPVISRGNGCAAIYLDDPYGELFLNLHILDGSTGYPYGKALDFERHVAKAAENVRKHGVDFPNIWHWTDPLGLSCTITPAEITGKTRTEIRDLARNKGLVPAGELDSAGNPRKWKDPVTGKERLRLD